MGHPELVEGSGQRIELTSQSVIRPHAESQT